MELFALVYFNVGVEIGQVVFVLFMVVLLRVLRSVLNKPPSLNVEIPFSLIKVAGSLGMFWFVQRVVTML